MRQAFLSALSRSWDPLQTLWGYEVQLKERRRCRLRSRRIITSMYEIEIFKIKSSVLELSSPKFVPFRVLCEKPIRFQAFLKKYAKGRMSYYSKSRYSNHHRPDIQGNMLSAELRVLNLRNDTKRYRVADTETFHLNSP